MFVLRGSGVVKTETQGDKPAEEATVPPIAETSSTPVADVVNTTIGPNVPDQETGTTDPAAAIVGGILESALTTLRDSSASALLLDMSKLFCKHFLS